MTAPVFVYGTLRHRPLLEALVQGPVDARPATLADHRVTAWPDAPLPFLEAYKGGQVEGLLLSGLTDAQSTALDAYEVPFGYFPERRQVTTAQGDVCEARVYYPAPDVVGSEVLWSLDDWVEQMGAVSVLAASEIAAHDPPLTPQELRRQWPMIQSRAHSTHRAASERTPATLRHSPEPADFDVSLRGPLMGGFFKLAQMSLEHRRFDGQTSGPLPREAFVGVDAALILPYDPVRDRVLLVEQFRAGPAQRGDPNPWALEPVAGIIDGGETPEQAAIREAQEEAGLTIAAPERMFAMYASPGSSTDHFFCFLGEVDLPSLVVSHGGLAEEYEDLRLHVLPLADALRLIETGEANIGPLIAMLLWTARRYPADRSA